jgi:hypothetical protein
MLGKATGGIRQKSVHGAIIQEDFRKRNPVDCLGGFRIRNSWAVKAINKRYHKENQVNQYKLARLTIERIVNNPNVGTFKDGHWARNPDYSCIELSCSCTEPLTVEWFKTEMQNFFSSLPSFSEYEARYTQSGEMHSHLIRFEEDKRKLSEVAEEISWWLLRELCERGWEPYAVKTYYDDSSTSNNIDGDVYYLRSEVAIQVP